MDRREHDDSPSPDPPERPGDLPLDMAHATLDPALSLREAIGAYRPPPHAPEEKIPGIGAAIEGYRGDPPLDAPPDDGPRTAQEILGGPFAAFAGLSDAEAWIDRRTTELHTTTGLNVRAARTRASGEWQVNLQAAQEAKEKPWIKRSVRRLHATFTWRASGRPSGEWQHLLAGLPPADDSYWSFEPRIFGHRLPLRVELLLPEIVRERVPRLKANRTTVAFPWDSRSYIWERGDDRWWRLAVLGHKWWLDITRDGDRYITQVGR